MSDGAIFPHGKTKCDQHGHHLHHGARGRPIRGITTIHSGWFCNTCGWTPWNGKDEIFTAEQVRRLTQ